MKVLVLGVVMLCIASGARAQATGDISIQRVTAAPKIDGILDDEAWKIEP